MKPCFLALRGLGAAVAQVKGSIVNGVARFIQTDEDTCVIEGTVDGLRPGKHHIRVHEFGDMSDGCLRCDRNCV